MNEIDNEEINKQNESFFSNSGFFLLEDVKDVDLQKKKELVQTEIVNKNYEYKHFEDFCNSRKQVNGNINLFSLEELKSLISDFVKLHTPHPQSGNYNNPQFINIKSCKLIEKTPINDKVVKISITNPKEVQTSFYQQNYTSYDVHTDLTLWKVNRRFSDFIWLRNTLTKFYPGVYCPPIPEKKAGPARFEEKFVEKRRLFLTQFINDLTKIEIYKSSEVLIDFLSTKDRNRFEREKENFDSKNEPALLEDNWSFNGQVNLMEDSKKIDNYYKNIGKYLDMQSELLDGMRDNLKLYYTNINEAYLNLCNIEKGFKLLNELNKKYSVREEISKVYFELSRFFKNWKSIQYEQNDIIKRYIKRFYKYTSMECKAFLELIQKRNDYKDNFVDKNTKLKEKKEKLWRDKNINDWEIEKLNPEDSILLKNDKIYALDKMCTSETKNVNNLYDMLCYLNYTLNEQFKIFMNKQSQKFMINIKNFTEEFKNNLNKAVESWSQIASLEIKK